MSCIITDPWFLFTEKTAHGDLLNYLKTAQTGGVKLPESEMMHFVKGILDGLQHLYQQRVILTTSHNQYFALFNKRVVNNAVFPDIYLVSHKTIHCLSIEACYDDAVSVLSTRLTWHKPDLSAHWIWICGGHYG